jgi:TfoX/Sxy family transcriptional regulator of competence genes
LSPWRRRNIPYDEKIEKAIEAVAGRWRHMGKKSMFGGISCLLKGNMCFGVYRDFLIVRAGKEKAEEAIGGTTCWPAGSGLATSG